MPDPINPDNPELRLLAQLAGLAPSKLAAAINEPTRFLEHLSLEDIDRWNQSWLRTAGVIGRINTAIGSALAHLTQPHEES